MAVVNRSLDASEQRDTYVANFAATGTAATFQVAMFPSAGVLEGIRMAGFGVSGSPLANVNILRFITGAGVTTIGGVATQLAFTAVGTSGVQSMVLAAAGSSLLSIQAGDILTATITGANSNLLGLSVAAVVKNTQEIKTSFGI